MIDEDMGWSMDLKRTNDPGPWMRKEAQAMFYLVNELPLQTELLFLALRYLHCLTDDGTIFDEPSIANLPEKHYLISGSCILLAWKIFEDRWPQRTRMKSHLIGDSIFRRFKPEAEGEPSISRNDKKRSSDVPAKRPSIGEGYSAAAAALLTPIVPDDTAISIERCVEGESLQHGTGDPAGGCLPTPLQPLVRDICGQELSEGGNIIKKRDDSNSESIISIQWDMIDAYLVQCKEAGNMATDIMNEYVDGARDGLWSAEKVKRIVIIKYTQYLIVLERRLCELLSNDIFALKRQPSLQFNSNGDTRLESSHDWGVLSYIEDAVKMMLKHQDEKRRQQQSLIKNNSNNTGIERILNEEDEKLIDELIERLMILPSNDHSLTKLSTFVRDFSCNYY